MEKFRLYICAFNLKISSRIDEWIRLAVKKEVKEFDIDLEADYLSSCKIKQPSDTLMLCSLKSLTLEKHLRVSKALKLKFIMIQQPSNELVSVEITAPSLQVCWLVKLRSRLCIDMAGLKSLDFRFCASLKAIHLDTPNLIPFFYYLNPIPIAVTNAPRSYWKVFICPSRDIDTSWFMNLKEFLGVANQIVGLLLKSSTLKKISFNLDGVRESFASFRCQGTTLNLSVGIPLSDYRALLDGLLWSCCPRTLYVNAIEENGLKFLQLKRFDSGGVCFISGLNVDDNSVCNGGTTYFHEGKNIT
ncbi:hypothetical protein Patl1_34244 [Pistacia atlantica]|uniref:Uncharacterized protein n=1 Tax=Pistacia atlantica TaxID=434234 RepID=A0ACC0ZSZ7_9ROSI|nr:hypothetical protein Patl1_34244 [Pistacia atlantica]